MKGKAVFPRHRKDFGNAQPPTSDPLWRLPFGHLPTESLNKLLGHISIEEDTGIKALGVPTSVRLQEQNKELVELVREQATAMKSMTRDGLHGGGCNSSFGQRQ